MSIKHISIPYDQLSLFKQEQKYQTYLIETLIYSTKVTIHTGNNKSKFIMILTKHNLWLEDEKSNKRVMKIQLSAIQNILKCQEHPQFTIFTDQNNDNLRISASNQERCDSILSALSFCFNFFSKDKRALKIFFLKQNSLVYFERTVKQKKSSSKFNLTRYQFKQINYVQPVDSPDLFGKLVIHKFILLRQYICQQSHLLHLAKINNDSELYLCHTVQKDEQLIKKIKEHQNKDFIEKLVYSRNLQYKTQLLFQKTSSFQKCRMSLSELFVQLYGLYDKMKKVQKESYLSPQLLCFDSNNKLKMRQFRYQEIIFEYEYKRLIYQRKYHQKDQKDYSINKMYNIGMIMYYFMCGRHLFDHEDIETSIFLKQNLKGVFFPTFVQINYSKKTKNFVQNCITGKIVEEYENIMLNPWIKSQVIKLQ